MSTEIEMNILDNNGLLGKAIGGTILSLDKTESKIIFVNTSYDNNNGVAPCAGLRYILDLRGTNKDSSPVIFYGFETRERLEKHPEGSILSSPGVEYIQMPFKIGLLESAIEKVSKIDLTRKPLGGNAAKALAEGKRQELSERIRAFAHDCGNGITYLSPLLASLQDASGDYGQTFHDLMDFGPDFISKKLYFYESIRKETEDLFRRCSGVKEIPSVLKKAEVAYKLLREGIAKRETIKNPIPPIVAQAQNIIRFLKRVEDVLNRCRSG